MSPPRLITFCLVVAACPALAGERWISVRAPHVQVVANTSAGTAHRLARDLTAFRSALYRLVPGSDARAEALTTVILFDDPGSMTPLYPAYEGKRRPVGGLFARGDDRNYVVVAVKANEMLRNAFHEYTHVLLSRTGQPLPLWLGEGLSELYSNADVRKDEVVIGRELRDHARLLKERGLLPLETLFGAGQDSPEYNEPGRQDRFYAQSWAVAHYVFVGAGRGPAFMQALAAGASSAEALASVLGVPPERQQKTLASYVGRLGYPLARAPVQRMAADALREEKIEPHEAQFYQGDCLAHLGRLDDARPFLEKAISLSPSYAAPYRALGLAHYHAGDYSSAVRWLSGAVERSPDDGFARFLRATSAVKGAGGSFGPAAAAGVREDLRAAVAALPDMPEPWQLMAYVDSVLGRIDDEAVRTLRRAIALSPPGRRDLQERLDTVLARRGEVKAP